MTDNDEIDASEPSYRVTEVAGHEPVSLDELVGATTVTVDTGGHENRLIGAGEQHGATVRFHDKENGSAPDAEPVWTFTDQGSGIIAATPPPQE